MYHRKTHMFITVSLQVTDLWTTVTKFALEVHLTWKRRQIHHDFTYSLGSHGSKCKKRNLRATIVAQIITSTHRHL